MGSAHRQHDNSERFGPAVRAKTSRIAAMLLIAASALTHPRPAAAYRPFDLTDASVADPGEVELEIGPVGSLRSGSSRWWIAPALVANFGLHGERELVIEGKRRSAIGGSADGPRTSLVDTAVSLKQVLRAGSLQGKSGLSVASECGVLLPTWHEERGVGAGCSFIGSQQWSAGALHLNGGLTFNRQHHWTRLAGAILEGPGAWPVRPVAEGWLEREVNGSFTRSTLVGVIWRVNEHLSFDAGARRATTSGTAVREIRAGLTWAPQFAR